MGYSTEFEGSVTVEPLLNPHEVAYLRKFSQSRRVHRQRGPFYVDGPGDHGHDKDIISYNTPAQGQPGLWCDWEPTEDGTAIRWNGSEKFYCGQEWMVYLIDHFLTRPGKHAEHSIGHPSALLDTELVPTEFSLFTWDHVVNGVIVAQGAIPDDQWRLVVVNNVVTRKEGH